MEKYIDVIKQTLELSETGLEGLQHMQAQIEEGFFEQSLTLFTDVLAAHFEIEKSVALFSENLPENKLSVISQQLNEAAVELAETYEKGERSALGDVLGIKVIPQYTEWKEELYRCLHPYVVA
ncbi:hypothetical protein ACTID9_27005 [Brevibacillus fluminis]|uniref:hypothetical protein n=1 Tax=Brevibacillus fluminis TaxID=511487 RepID=UPI003F899763